MKIKKGVIAGMVLGVMGIAGVYATLNIDTTINNLYSYVKYLFVTSDGTANGTKNIILNGENGRIDAKSVYVNGKEVATEEYVNNKASDTLTEAENYTNTKSNQILNEAKNYTNSKSNQVLNEAKNYTNSKSNQVLSSAKSYADQKKVEAINVAKAYTNNHVVDGAHIANGAITSEKIKNGAVTEDKLSDSLKSKISFIGGVSPGSIVAIGPIKRDHHDWGKVSVTAPQDGWYRGIDCYLGGCAMSNRFYARKGDNIEIDGYRTGGDHGCYEKILVNGRKVLGAWGDNGCHNSLSNYMIIYSPDQ